MKTHELKCDPEQFDLVASGFKRFEIRKNDRDFRDGDQLLLRETWVSGRAMASGAELKYTGRECLVLVLHVMTGGKYGLEQGYVVMSISKLSPPPDPEVAP